MPLKPAVGTISWCNRWCDSIPVHLSHCVAANWWDCWGTDALHQPAGGLSKWRGSPAAVFVITATLHTSSHHGALIPARQGKSISNASTVRVTTERIECQESHRRKVKGGEERKESQRAQERLLMLYCSFFSFSLSPLQPPSPRPSEAEDYGNVCYIATLSFRGSGSKGG